MSRAVLPISTDDRHSFRLDGAPPTPPTPPGESIHITAETASIMRGSIDLFIAGMCDGWTIDRLLIDDRDMLDEPRLASTFGRPRIFDVDHARRFELHATNTTDQPSYFYATFVGDADAPQPSLIVRGGLDGDFIGDVDPKKVR